MKNQILSLIGIVISVSLYAQKYDTGDATFDAKLTSINVEANKDLVSFKANVVKTYSSNLTQVNSFFSAGMNAGDVIMSFELMKLTNKPAISIISIFNTHKSKGWGAMAKELGIKPGSKEFHALKNSASGKQGKMNKKTSASKGNSSNKGGNGNGKGKK